MSKYLLLILGFSLTTLHAADPSPEDLLRQGLFEEEANQNLDKAAEHYRAVIAAHDRQRALAASATFRLGEVARKKNDKETAAAAFRTVAERFPEQAELARLSRENLAALGVEITAPAAPASADPEDAEIARLKEIARNSPDLIDGAGADGWRPIHHAAAKGWSRVIAYLLENKADPNARTSTDEKITPLHLAAIHGHLSAVKTFLAGKADANLTIDIKSIFHERFPPTGIKVQNVEGPWTALDLAILYNRRETALALIQAGTDFLRKGPLISGGFRGANSLQLAIYFQRNDLAQTMIDAASSPGPIREDLPLTTLAIAVNHNTAMVEPLLKAGANPKQGIPLLTAAAFDRLEAAKILLEAGADVKATNEIGLAPLHYAKSVEMAELLISKGADTNAKDSSGLTALDHVAKRDEVGSNAELIETLLKHGATVADPRELLRRTSEAMLPFVGERLVYPKVHNPEAILLSVSGYHSFNPEPPPGGRTPRARVAGRSQQESRPEIIALETRATPASPPPSLAEVMCMAFSQSGYLRSIRITRRGEKDRIDIIREWTESGDNSLPTDWSALEWGDIVEVRNSSGGRSGAPTIGDFAAMIPARSVTFRLGGLEFPEKIPGEGSFWLGYQTLLSWFPNNIHMVADPNRFVIHRKGLPEPITLDFSKPTDTRFRLLDGDTVEVSWDIPKLYQRFNDDQLNNILWLEKAGAGVAFHGRSLVDFLSRQSDNGPVDFSKICILRRAENWKPEMVDFKAWLEQLPPREKWVREELVKSAPHLNPGDAVILIDNPAADAEKTAAEVRRKGMEVSDAMTPRTPRPKVIPPPQR